MLGVIHDSITGGAGADIKGRSFGGLCSKGGSLCCASNVCVGYASGGFGSSGGGMNCEHTGIGSVAKEGVSSVGNENGPGVAGGEGWG